MIADINAITNNEISLVFYLYNVIFLLDLIADACCYIYYAN